MAPHHPPASDKQSAPPARSTRKGGSLYSATCNSLDGLAVLFKERAARRELLLIVATGLIYVLLPNTHTLLLLVLALVLLAVEALNTAIEVLCDHVTLEIHPAIKKAKDLGSAAIF
ncbi:MAG: diacylglycerol kinase, partial [Comamonadaceae bacterium]|nr:diacylglycerol kinase [Comamonadaceae bacterium]